MSNDKTGQHAVPASRISRLARFGGLGASVAGNMLVDGAQRLAKGERPGLQDLLLTPSNASKLAGELSKLRGAAMKVGQILSMDGGDFVPPEFAEVLERLRAQAHSMPPHQLKKALTDNWGRGWLKTFSRFDVKPLAAASIGQVHRAVTTDGRDLAIKIQYPGIRDSIDSDVDNAASLIRLSGLVPEGVDVAPLLEAAKDQLKEEADYEREGAALHRFRNLLAGDDAFFVPELHEDLTTKDILAMTYAAGDPIESLETAGQTERNRVVETMMDLLMRELFEFRLMQTDPNFANYLYDKSSGKIVLLDFGASREIEPALSDGYRAILRAGVHNDWDAVRAGALEIGLIAPDVSSDEETMLRDLLTFSLEPTHCDGAYDFGATDLAVRIRDKGMELRMGGYVHVPPPALVFFHRKFGGIYLLAAKLGAVIDVKQLVSRYVAA